MTPPTKKEERGWEKEIGDVFETAASTDDRSDIDCVISYVRELLSQAKQRWQEETKELLLTSGRGGGNWRRIINQIFKNEKD